MVTKHYLFVPRTGAVSVVVLGTMGVGPGVAVRSITCGRIALVTVVVGSILIGGSLPKE
jgi:hypothetical protein